ncbi:laccase domain-containing protein [Nonomuraea salmonea]|uniref:polyphenol oxidase family protein n=1 Tax=Nonomuraea salmonea TaxID=46181 RepID=UPI002FE9507F
MRQVHSAEVAYVSEPYGDDPPPLDGVFTTEPRLALASLGADCPAVLVADPVARMVGAAHSGRPGTEAGIATALVTAMAAKGAEPGRMVALIGPGACGRCYEVPAALRAQVAEKVPATWSTTSWNTPRPGPARRHRVTAESSRRPRHPPRHPLHDRVGGALLPPPRPADRPLRRPHLAHLATRTPHVRPHQRPHGLSPAVVPNTSLAPRWTARRAFADVAAGSAPGRPLPRTDSSSGRPRGPHWHFVVVLAGPAPTLPQTPHRRPRTGGSPNPTGTSLQPS